MNSYEINPDLSSTEVNAGEVKKVEDQSAPGEKVKTFEIPEDLAA